MVSSQVTLKPYRRPPPSPVQPVGIPNLLRIDAADVLELPES